LDAVVADGAVVYGQAASIEDPSTAGGVIHGGNRYGVVTDGTVVDRQSAAIQDASAPAHLTKPKLVALLPSIAAIELVAIELRHCCYRALASGDYIH